MGSSLSFLTPWWPGFRIGPSLIPLQTRVAKYTHTPSTLHNFRRHQPSALRLSSLYLE